MRRFARKTLFALTCLGVTACAVLPDLGASGASVGPRPQILPLAALNAEAAAGEITPVIGADLAARAARLRARAAVMRGPVQDPATRARLSAGG